MRELGCTIWAIPEGYIPSGSVSEAHDLVSHETACFLNAGDPDARIAIPIIGGIGALVVTFTMLLSLPSIIAGAGLLYYKPWARILTLILSVFLLIHIPFGTALGFYGFWVLLSKETLPLFENRGVQRPGANRAWPGMNV